MEGETQGRGGGCLGVKGLSLLLIVNGLYGDNGTSEFNGIGAQLGRATGVIILHLKTK